MAVPKTKVSKSRKSMRSAHNFKATAMSLTSCRNCHEPIPPHTVCKKCGFYDGSKRIETSKDKKERKKAE